MLSIGLMSGTSMDGIDAALIKTDGEFDITEIADASLDYDVEFQVLLRAAEMAVRQTAGDLEKAKPLFSDAIENYLINALGIPNDEVFEEIKRLSSYFHASTGGPITLEQVIQRSTELHVDIVKTLLKKSGLNASDITVIGYHGQTLFHRPGTISLQVGDGKLLAEKCGITVINNFRNKDIAAGGQGAPFAPLYHQALAVRDNIIPAAVVNCGGIANITLITGKKHSDVSGFDTGPGNALIDRYVKRKTNGKEQMDRNGEWGRKGQVSEAVMKNLYDHAIVINQKNYFDLQAPKSLDSGDLTLVPELDELSMQDACATLEAFTADTIVRGIEYLPEANIPQYWILAGGGWNNPVIRSELQNRLKSKFGAKIKMVTAEEAGWSSKALEAQIFAYLAVRSLKNLPISLPSTTQVPEPMSGGEIHSASS
jgi:anhydro-N-acetylmuramic acid kinase